MNLNREINIMSEFTKEEYEKKRIEIIDNFTKEFHKKGERGHAMTITIIESLIRGENPYNIIEQLVKNQDELIEKLKDLCMHLPPKPIIIER
ncbi:hypothetical protein [Flavobacterium aestivum]|uniref:hypothetical protein n=1 Tax=Flavobacterium aestivum TaxID=3003257 RepID=UPI002482D621|nr:hypothetical protein [Flavobacterium aestivum]